MGTMTLAEAWKYVGEYGDTIPNAYETDDLDEVIEKTDKYAEMVEHLLKVEKLTKLPQLEDQKYALTLKLQYFGAFSPESEQHYKKLLEEIEEIEEEIEELYTVVEVEEFELDSNSY